MRGWEHHDDDARCDCRPADAELIKCSHKRLRVLFSKLSLFCDCTQENMKYKDCSYCLVERLRLWHNFGIVITIFPLQGRATSSSGRGCCCCCLGTLLGNALSPPTAKLGKIMNLCSSGATASTTSLSSTGQAERAAEYQEEEQKAAEAAVTAAAAAKPATDPPRPQHSALREDRAQQARSPERRSCPTPTVRPTEQEEQLDQPAVDNSRLAATDTATFTTKTTQICRPKRVPKW